jgi:hypothetical protein
MNSDQTPKLPLPSEASDFRFLVSASAPGHAVLEFDTPTNPVRVFLSAGQIERLAVDARLTVAKLTR